MHLQPWTCNIRVATYRMGYITLRLHIFLIKNVNFCYFLIEACSLSTNTFSQICNSFPAVPELDDREKSLCFTQCVWHQSSPKIPAPNAKQGKHIYIAFTQTVVKNTQITLSIQFFFSSLCNVETVQSPNCTWRAGWLWSTCLRWWRGCRNAL